VRPIVARCHRQGCGAPQNRRGCRTAEIYADLAVHVSEPAALHAPPFGGAKRRACLRCRAEQSAPCQWPLYPYYISPILIDSLTVTYFFYFKKTMKKSPKKRSTEKIFNASMRLEEMESRYLSHMSCADSTFATVSFRERIRVKMALIRVKMALKWSSTALKQRQPGQISVKAALKQRERCQNSVQTAFLDVVVDCLHHFPLRC
jgi:hypothetical protein